MLFNQDKPKDN